jgi:hypothetical protein
MDREKGRETTDAESEPPADAPGNVPHVTEK